MNPMLDKQGGIIMTRKKIVERIEEILMTFNLHDICDPTRENSHKGERTHTAR